MTGTTTLTFEALKALIGEIFLKAGFSPLAAASVAATIAAGERDACKSHGVYRIEGCLRTVKAGKVVPDAVPEVEDDGASGIIRVDAMNGFSGPAFEAGAPLVVELAHHGPRSGGHLDEAPVLGGTRPDGSTITAAVPEPSLGPTTEELQLPVFQPEQL